MRGDHVAKHIARMASLSPEQRKPIIERMVAQRTAAAKPTAEQMARIVAIHEAAMADLTPLLAQRKAQQDKMKALWTAPQIDTVAVQTLRNEIKTSREKTREQVRERLFKARMDSANVLSADQRKALQDAAAHRHEGRGGHTTYGPAAPHGHQTSPLHRPGTGGAMLPPPPRPREVQPK